MYTPLEALYMNPHACSTTAQPTYHKTVLSRTKGQTICSEETILAAELHHETRQNSSYYTKVCIHQVWSCSNPEATYKPTVSKRKQSFRFIHGEDSSVSRRL